MPSRRHVLGRQVQNLASGKNVGRYHRPFEHCGCSVLSFLHPEWTMPVRRMWPRGPILLRQNQDSLRGAILREWRFLFHGGGGEENLMSPYFPVAPPHRKKT